MKGHPVTTIENPAPYHTGACQAPEPPLDTEDLVARAHANRQGIRYETGEQWLDRLPPQMRVLAEVILGGQMTVGDVAYALAALIDRVEHAPVETAARRH